MTSAASKALDFVKARREAGLSDETMHVLLQLFQDGASGKVRIAAVTAINPTTLPRYLATLLASGHLARREDEKDRREKLFVLTEHGQRLVRSLLRHFPNPPP